MDPVNLSGIQNTPSDCKSYAGIRSPAGCACCGLKDYPQNIPQAYCFTALCPGLSKCKAPQEHPQDSFAIPHPIFSTFPFQQHFFHSTIMPPNFCCTQKLSSDVGTNPSQIQLKNEHKINHQHQPDNHPPQKEKSEFADTIRNINEEPQKNIPETTYTYQTEPQPNAVFQRCVCGDSIPWACSPFIVPVFSYCFLWNSQATSTLLSKTYNSYITETLCQKNCKKQETQKYSCATECEQQPQIPTEEPPVANVVTKCDKNTDSAEIFQEFLELNELAKTELKTEEQEESTEQDESEFTKNESDANFEEEIIEDMLISIEDEFETGDDSEIRDQTESVRSEESLKVDENESPAPDSSENLPKYLEDSAPPDAASPYTPSPVTASSATESSINLKSPPKSSEHSLNDTLSENPSNIWSSEIGQEIQEGQESQPKKEANPSTAPKEEPEEKNSEPEEPDTSKTTSKEVVIKKCIKNFTVTDEINGAPSQEVQMSAAGDLGADSCDSCKIQTTFDENIEPIPKESFKSGVANEESEPPEPKAQKVSDEGERKNAEVIHPLEPVVQRVPDEGDRKSIEEDNQSPGPKFKSGIAKLSSNNSNLKSPKSSTAKTTKKSKNHSNEKQSNSVRGKHCCFPAENTNSKNETPPKIQRTKKSTLAQNPAPVSGPETPKKSVNTRQTLKKDHPTRKPARPVNLSENSPKAVKTLLKK